MNDCLDRSDEDSNMCQKFLEEKSIRTNSETEKTRYTNSVTEKNRYKRYFLPSMKKCMKTWYLFAKAFCSNHGF